MATGNFFTTYLHRPNDDTIRNEGRNKQTSNERFFYGDYIYVWIAGYVRTSYICTSSFFTLGTLGLVDLTISMKFMFLYVYILIPLGKATQTTYKIWPACYSFEVLNLRVSKG